MPNYLYKCINTEQNIGLLLKELAEIEINNNKKILEENQSAYIPLGSKHRLTNPEVNL